MFKEFARNAVTQEAVKHSRMQKLNCMHSQKACWNNTEVFQYRVEDSIADFWSSTTERCLTFTNFYKLGNHNCLTLCYPTHVQIYVSNIHICDSEQYLFVEPHFTLHYKPDY